MKKLVGLILSILLSSTVATRINAQGIENLADIKQEEYTSNSISPSALVGAAYRGRFRNWDIPSYGQLQLSYDSGKLTANDLIDAGIEAGELSPQAAEDEKYIRKVDTELKQLHED